MAVVAPEHWFLGADQTRQRPHFTTGNSGTAFVDGKGYMADLRTVVTTCTGELFIAGWRVTAGQILNPADERGEIVGETLIEALTAAAKQDNLAHERASAHSE